MRISINRTVSIRLAAVALSLLQGCLAAKYQVSAADNAAIGSYNTGLEELRAKRLPEAENCFKQAIDVDPSFAMAHWNLGVVRSQLKHFEEALPELQQAVSLNPRLGGAWNSLGVCLVGLGRLPEAVAAFRKYLQLEPNGAMAPNLRNAIPVLEAEAKRSAGGAASASDYYQQSVAAHFGHWAKMPITVYIEPAHNVRGFRPEFVDLLKKSLSEWQQSSQGEVSFVYTDNPAKAQLKCAFTDSVKQAINLSEGGHCSAHQSDAGEIENAYIVIMTVTPVGVELSDQMVHRVALHEIGHALGLGHSSNAKDIMYIASLGGAVDASLSERDARTIQHLYKGIAVGKGATAVAAEPAQEAAQQAQASPAAEPAQAAAQQAQAIPAAEPAQAAAQQAQSVAAGDTANSGSPSMGSSVQQSQTTATARPPTGTQIAVAAASAGESGALAPIALPSVAPGDEHLKQARQLVEVGNRLLKSRLIAAGIAQLEDAYKLSPNDAICAASLGTGYGVMADDALDQKDYTEAELCYRKAIPLLETMPNGNLSVVLKKYSAMLHSLQRGSEAQPIEAKLGALNAK